MKVKSFLVLSFHILGLASLISATALMLHCFYTILTAGLFVATETPLMATLEFAIAIYAASYITWTYMQFIRKNTK